MTLFQLASQVDSIALDAATNDPELQDEPEEIESPFGFGLPVKRSKTISSMDIGVTDELDRYFSTAVYARSKEAPAQFWSSCKHAFPHLFQLATQLLACPASSASVERMFSVLNRNTTQQKGRTSPNLLKSKVLLNFNRSFIDI